MRFSQSFLDEIRSRIPIADVVGQRVAWDKRKSQPQRGDYWACCPFHGEKTPSFHADNRRGRYHCFGCGVSGDHFTFLVEQEGLTFPQAVEQLAGEAGLPLPARDPELERRETRRQSLYDVMDKAAAFFQQQLQANVGARARSYLAERGLPPQVQERFGIGYAPDSRSALKQYLADAGISHDQMVETGLLIAGDDIPVSYDRFRDRVIFPIADLRGRVIAFGGRALSPDAPAKYLNSPETPLFHKSQVLFNSREAREAARKGGTVVAVEGYTDVIACVEAGFAATVAPLGTALTEDQLRLLWQMADEPVLCFDGDEAGLKAAYRAVDLALPMLVPGKSLRFVLLPEGQDPDGFVREAGNAAFESLIGDAIPLFDILWNRETAGRSFDTPERKAGLSARLREIVSTITDGSVRRYYSEGLWEREQSFFRIRRASKKAPANSGSRGFRGGDRDISPSGTLQKNRLTQRRGNSETNAPSLPDAILIGTLINHTKLAADRLELLDACPFGDRRSALVASAIAVVLMERPECSRDILLERLSDQGFETQASQILAKLANSGLADLQYGGDPDRAAAIWDDALHLRRRSRLLSNERKLIAKTVGEDGGALELSRLRDIQEQTARADQSQQRGEGTQQTLAHPLKAGQ